MHAHMGERIGMRFCAGQVVQFARVVFDIEELAAVADRIVDQLVAALADHAAGGGVFAALAVEVVPPFFAEHRLALNRIGNVDAGQIK